MFINSRACKLAYSMFSRASNPLVGTQNMILLLDDPLTTTVTSAESEAIIMIWLLKVFAGSSKL